jgi:hypothetical protein
MIAVQDTHTVGDTVYHVQIVGFPKSTVHVWLGRGSDARLRDLVVSLPNQNPRSTAPSATSLLHPNSERASYSERMAARLASRYGICVFVSIAAPPETPEEVHVIEGVVHDSLSRALDPNRA